MPVLELDFFAKSAPNGSVLGTLTDAELSAWSIRVEFRAEGSGAFTIPRRHVAADPALLQTGRIVKATVPVIGATYVFAFILEEGDFELLHEEGDEDLTFGGPGVLAVLRDALLTHTPTAPGQTARGSADLDGKWWWIGQPYGAIAVRVVEEGKHMLGAPLQFVTLTYTRTIDSSGAAWTPLAEEYEQPIGANVGEIFADLAKAGDFIPIMAPDLELSVFQDPADCTVDRTSATFAAGKVRLTEANILTEISRRDHGKRRITHLLGQASNGDYFTRTHPDYVSGPAKWGNLGRLETNDDAMLIRIANHAFADNDAAADSIEVEIVMGDDPTIGHYRPFLDFGAGDLVTLHTGVGPFDYNETEQRIQAFRMELGDATDDATNVLAARSFRTILELNSSTAEDGASISGSAAPATGTTPGGGGGGGGSKCTCLELCRAATPLATDWIIDWTWAGGAAESVAAYAELGQPAASAPHAGATGITLNAGGWLEDDVGADESTVPGSDGTNLYMGFPVVAGQAYVMEAQLRIETGVGGLTPKVRVAWYSGDYVGGYTFLSYSEYIATTTGSEVFTDVAGVVAAPAGATGGLLIIGGNTWVHYFRIGVQGVTEGQYPGDGLPELIGNGPRAARCDHRHLVIRDAAPTMADDETAGFGIGVFWTDTVTRSTYLLLDATAGAADWLELGGAGGGGAEGSFGQVHPYPTTFTGDSEDMTAVTNWTDVTAFSTKEILGGTILHLRTIGPNKNQRVRKTLGTTKAGVFDFRFHFAASLVTWGGARDTYFEITLRTSGGTIVAIARLYGATALGYGFLEVGPAAPVTTNVNVEAPLAMPTWLRISRSGANVLSFEYGYSASALALAPVLKFADNTPYLPTNAGTVARVELALVTPAGPGAAADYLDAWIDTFESV